MCSSKKLLIFLAIIIIVSAREALGLTCYCDGHHCPNHQKNGTCEAKPGAFCFSAVQGVYNEDSGRLEPKYSFGCLPPGLKGFSQCKGIRIAHPKFRSNVTCCNDSDLCNQEVFPNYEPVVYNKLKFPYVSAFIVTSVIVGSFVVVLILALVLIFKQPKNEQADEFKQPLDHSNRDSLELSSASDSGAGLPILVQATISKQIKLSSRIGRGRYGEVWLAEWRGEKVAVKTFPSIEETSWLREMNIYNTPSMRHDNILGFVASDISGVGSSTLMLLVTDYQATGSLFDYLQSAVLDRDALIRICLSIASGVLHLHSQINVFSRPHKPAIAHRDIKSKNILVKNNGECVIADFGLAIRETEVNDEKINLQVGTRRYMSPEVLDQSLARSSFDYFLMSDMYSVGLVLWEVCRRYTSSVNKEVVALKYELPYHDLVSNDPGFEEMQEIVSTLKLRPEIPDTWENDPTMAVLRKWITECWHAKPSVRPTAFRLKSTIAKL